LGHIQKVAGIKKTQIDYFICIHLFFMSVYISVLAHYQKQEFHFSVLDKSDVYKNDLWQFPYRLSCQISCLYFKPLYVCCITKCIFMYVLTALFYCSNTDKLNKWKSMMVTKFSLSKVLPIELTQCRIHIISFNENYEISHMTITVTS
jgi:hypothetical protein